MQQQLINHSPDLKRLADEGYDMEVCGGHIFVHRIPYVASTKKVKFGSLACPLSLIAPSKAGSPNDHTMFFAGEEPCDNMGVPLIAIINSPTNNIIENQQMNYLFSSKPSSGSYKDFYDKFRTYALILSTNAQAIEPTVTAQPNFQITDKHD